MNTLETVDLKHRSCLTDRFHQMNLQISDYTSPIFICFVKSAIMNF